MSRRELGLAAVGIGLFGAISWLFSLFPKDVQTGLTTAGSLTLVAVTIMYVLLTRDLVKAQRETYAQAREIEERRERDRTTQSYREATALAWRQAMSDPVNWRGVSANLASLGVGSEWASVRRRVDEIAAELEDSRGFSTELVKHAIDAPMNLQILIWRAGALCTKAAVVGLNLKLAALEEENEASEPTIEGLRTRWTVDHRPVAGGLEWDDLVTGEFAREAERAIEELEVQAYEMGQHGHAAPGAG